MHRILWRVSRRSLSSSDFSNFRPRARTDAADGVHSAHSFANPHDNYSFGWRGSLGNRLSQLQVVNALRRGERDSASVMLSNLGRTSISLTPDDFSYILEYCAEAPDPLFVMETWKVMEEKSINLNKGSFRSIIRALSKGGYSKEALDWLTLIGQNDQIHSALPMFNVFLGVSGEAKKLTFVDHCLEQMDKQLVGKSEITYWELLKIAVSQNNLPAVYTVWKDCTEYYSPSIITMRKFIWSFSRLGELDSAYTILQHMVILCISHYNSSSPIRVSHKNLYQSSRLDVPIPTLTQILDLSNAPNFALEVHKVNKNGDFLEKLPTPVKVFLRWSFNDIIHACSCFGNYELTEKLFLQMCELGLRPSRHMYDGFIKSVITAKGVTHGLQAVESMEKRNIEPYNDTLAAISVACSKDFELDSAESFLDRISVKLPKYIHAFNALLSACDIMNEPERAVRLLGKIKQFNMKLNIRTYELMFSLFGNVNVPYEKGNIFSHGDVSRRLSIIETDMSKNEIRHSFASMKNIIRALGAEGMIEEMLKYLKVAESMLWQIDPYKISDLYNIVLHALVKAKQTQSAIRIFKNMRLYSLPANIAIYNIMIECCSNFTCFKSASALVALMYRDGFSPQTLTFTSLIKVLLSSEDFTGALALLDLSKLEGIQPDIQLYNTLLREAYSKPRIHIIENLIERIKREKIQPDPSTVWYVFSCYAESGLHNTAMESLQVLSMRMISLEDSVLREKSSLLEELIYSEDSDAESKIIEMYKESEEFVGIALLNLRLCAIMGLPISWSPDESLWAKRLCSAYDSRRAHRS